jgi:vacuolar-type H+-ATPase subunit C/Vma6
MQYIADRQLHLAKESGSKDILQYVRHRIDLTNIRTAIRFISVGMADVSTSLIRGGLIPVASLGSTQENVRAAVARSPYYAILGADVFDLAKDAVVFERTAARITADDIGRMWNVPLTVEPAFAFAAIALAHIRIIRFIFIGKRNQLSPQEIKRVLPPFLPSTHYSA